MSGATRDSIGCNMTTLGTCLLELRGDRTRKEMVDAICLLGHELVDEGWLRRLECSERVSVRPWELELLALAYGVPYEELRDAAGY